MSLLLKNKKKINYSNINNLVIENDNKKLIRHNTPTIYIYY